MQAYAEIRNASPAYRLAIGQDNQPITLGNLQVLVADREGMLLEYLIGDEGAYVVVVPADDDPRLVKVEPSDEQARVLGVEAGPLTAAKIKQALTTADNRGVLDHLRRATSVETADVATPGLNALWNVLIPAAERETITTGEIERLILIPDGPLAMLPFEALVVSENGPKTEYLIDVGPPTIYAPSATILNNVLLREKHGNLFGTLALTPGDTQNPADDGFLTLSEIYGLDLNGCELAILSACSTNAGPQQQGEGVWALSRGFLVGGARRTVASNWPVDDEAAASLISYYCGGLALAEKMHGAGAVDYAAALHSARRWVRSQEKWQSPFYWSSFVLVGPN